MPGGLRRAEWRTPVPEWTAAGERAWPGPFSCVWHLPEGEFTYIKGRLSPADVAFNIPAEAHARS